MSPAEEQRYRDDCLARGMCWDIDAPPSAWLKTLVDGREARDQDASFADPAVAVISTVLRLVFPIVLLAGLVCFIYWLMR